MKAHIQFKSVVNEFTLELLRSHLEAYNFYFEKTPEGWKFSKRTGILAGWYTNPLQFASTLIFTIDNNTCSCALQIDSESTIFTKEAQACWEVFMEDMARIINGEASKKGLIDHSIAKAKSSIKFSYIFVAVGLLIGGGLGMLVKAVTEYHHFIYLGSIIGSIVGFKWNAVEREVTKSYTF